MIKPHVISAALIIAACLTGCTVHPAGEREEREAAMTAGLAFDARDVPPLPEHPSADDLVRRALRSNAELHQKYWTWRAAIEQVPQDGTQSTNLALFAGFDITRGTTGRDSTTLGLGNDPMADVVLPPKLSTAATRALEHARAAGLRFRRAQFELRAKVLSAHADYALTTELIRLEESNVQLLETSVTSVEARNRAGMAGQEELLRTRNELDLARNDLANIRSQLPARRGVLNSLLDLPVDSPIPAPDSLPVPRPLVEDDAQILKLAAERNPELSALRREMTAGRADITLAKLQYLPDLSLSASSDLAGITQSLAAMVTVPLLRYQAINAAVAQAEANLKGREAMRRQAGNDLAAELVMDLNTVRDADRQLDLIEQTVLPRARQMTTVTRSSYEAGKSSLRDLLDAQRFLIAIGRLRANIQVTREKTILQIEAATAQPLGVQKESMPHSSQ